MNYDQFFASDVLRFFDYILIDNGKENTTVMSCKE